MFKLPFKQKKKEEKKAFLTIDIGSQSIKCLAFKKTQDEEDIEHPIKLVGIGKEWLEPWCVRSGHIIEVDKVAKAIDSAIFKATEELEIDIDDVIFGVSGDVCDCIVTTAKRERENPDKEIKLKELEEMELKVVNSALIRAQERYATKTGDREPELELITTASVYTKIDDMDVTIPEGKTGKEIEMALFNAFTPKYYLKTLEELASILNLNIMAVTSNLYALNECIKKANETPKMDGIIMDIGSDTTDIAIVFGGGIVTSSSISLGGHQFTKHISTESGLNYAEAEKQKYDFSYDKLDDDTQEEIASYVDVITKFWLDGVELMFNNLEGIKTFASDIYLTGGGSKLPTIKDYLENKPWTKTIPFKEPPTINMLDIKDIAHVLDVTGEANKEEFIVPLALSTIFLEIR